MSISGEDERLLQHVAQVGLEQAARGLAEAAGFVRLGAERLHHHVAAEGLLQDLVQLRLPVLSAAAGAPDASADAGGGQHDERQHGEADERQLPIVAEHHEQQTDGAENLAQQIRQDLRGGHLDLVDVVHDGRHQLAGGVRFEELRRPGCSTLSNTALRRSVTAEKPA